MKEVDNKSLYESDEVVSKYAANTTRLRSLNNAEKFFIDRFDIKNKSILVIGSGAGRVPANLLLYGNRVHGIDRSEKLTAIASQNFPEGKFADLKFEMGDAIDLQGVSNESFDVVFFPMNTIDYINPYRLRIQAMQEAAKKVKPGGIVALSSHNKLGYVFSPKVHPKDRKIKNLFGNYYFDKEHVIGGGYIYKGNPTQVITEVVGATGFSFAGYTCDARNKFDRLFARKLKMAQFLFPYILYVFKKPL